MTIRHAATLPELVRERALCTPDKVFLQEVNGAASTYRQTHERALHWAGLLSAAGVKAGDTVATMLPNCVEGTLIWLALSWLRAIDIPLSVAYRGKLLSHALNLSRAKILFTDGETLPALETCAKDLQHLRRIILRDASVAASCATTALYVDMHLASQLLSTAIPLQVEGLPERHDIASAVFTSGTTGPSKAALIPWGYLTAGMSAMLLNHFDERDVIYHTSASNHTTTRLAIHTAAYVGMTLVLKKAFRTQDFWRDIDQYGCTYTMLIGAMTHFLMSEPPSPADTRHSLRKASMSPLHPQLEALRDRFGLSITTGYGMTECIGAVFGAGAQIDDIKSCGRLREGWPHFELRIVDEHDYEVPNGQVGELTVRAAEPWSIAVGYLGMPDKMADAWRNGWFHTGDAFRRDDEGRLYFVDRIKDAIRRRGENVSSFEVEMEVNAHPDVAESAAVGVAAADSEEEIKVYVVPKPGKTLDPAALIRFLIPRMARFAIPRFIEVLDELPRTPTQRVKKDELRMRPSSRTWDRVSAGIEIPK
jgi:crotonobetaine/carnitine-CoA ligase